MSRFLALIEIDEGAREAFTPDPEFLDRMARVTGEMSEAGALVDTAGLTESARGVRLRWSGGAVTAVDGPFTETKEVVGGYLMLEAADRADAVSWIERFLAAHPKDWSFTVQLREIDESPEI
ncbi:YciI family protein [Actinocorallia aurea]